MFSKYENFIVEFPTIRLQIDQNSLFDVVSAYFPRIYPKLWSLIDGTDDLKECIVNFVTNTQTIEVVDATVKTTATLRGYEFINSQVIEGIFDGCKFHACEVNNSQLIKSEIDNSDINKSKILTCNVESSKITDSYFQNGFLNGDMIGGVFRSGQLGPFATISPETKIVTDGQNFFDTKFEDDDDKGDVKGIMDFKGISKK
jgi:uncharacterized protein YjbI with pentapeptide repeats